MTYEVPAVAPEDIVHEIDLDHVAKIGAKRFHSEDVRIVENEKYEPPGFEGANKGE